MLKQYLDRLFFRGSAAREALNAIAKRLGAIERRLDSLAPRGGASAGVSPAVAGEIKKTRDDLSRSIREVIAALENERVIIRNLEAQMLDLQLSHPDGSHREVYKEIDKLLGRVERLENCPGLQADDRSFSSELQ